MTNVIASTDTDMKLPDRKQTEDRADAIYAMLFELWDEGLKAAENSNPNQRGWLWGDFWKAGNTLDCVMNYFAVRNPKDTKQLAPKLIERSLTYLFDKLHYPSNPYHWRDDYGWWGNAFATILRNADVLGLNENDATKALKERCEEAAIKFCWQKLYENAKENRDYKPDPNYKRSMFGEGYAAWNDHSAHDYEFEDDGKPRIKPEDNYMPVPNAVTNLGFWALSIGLFDEIDKKNKDSGYLTSMRDTADWFEKYHSNGYMFNGHDLINETPNQNMHKYWCAALDDGRRDRAWTADQGVFLYCCLRSLNYEPARSPRQLYLSEMLKQFVLGFLKGSNTLVKQVQSKVDGLMKNVLVEYEFDPKVKNDDNSSNFNDNYCTGPGVFMRYLGYSVPMVANTELEPFFMTLINDSADIAWQNRLPENEIRCWYDSYLENTLYFPYWVKPTPDRMLWRMAFQTASLDLYVALLRLYSLPKAEQSNGPGGS